ncbi:hypothetical protein B194_4654 [Serratia plymuthica A30]|nr:hypothetical protein B194_4654 [Serratia plymuthica A30]
MRLRQGPHAACPETPHYLAFSVDGRRRRLPQRAEPHAGPVERAH